MFIIFCVVPLVQKTLVVTLSLKEEHEPWPAHIWSIQCSRDKEISSPDVLKIPNLDFRAVLAAQDLL